MPEVATYNFSEKNKWRYRIYSYMRKRINSPHLANILYLSGPEDRERSVAVRKGFNPDRMIAVSNDQKIVETLRQQRKLAIHGDIVDVAQCFRDELSIISLDLCSGLRWKLRAVALLAMQSIRENGFLVVNLQRGRDAETNLWREAPGDNKHRGEQFYTLFMMDIASMIYARRLPEGWHADEIFNWVIENDKLVDASKMFPYKTYSYRSNKVTMDSVVIQKKTSLNISLVSDDFKKPRKVCRHSGEIGSDVTWHDANNIFGRVAAVRAVQSRRLNGDLRRSARA